MSNKNNEPVKEQIKETEKSVVEQEEELRRKFPSVTNPAKDFITTCMHVLLVLLLMTLCLGSILREERLKDEKVISSKEYEATVVNKYTEIGLFSNNTYVVEIQTSEGDKMRIYLSKNKWDSMEENKEYKFTISKTKSREGKVKVEELDSK